MNNYFETINWSKIMSYDSIQDNWDIFKQLVSDASSNMFLLLYPSQINPLHGGQKVYQDQLMQSILLFQDIKGLRLVQTTLIIRPKGTRSNLRSRLLKHHTNNLSLTSFIQTQSILHVHQKVIPDVDPLERNDGTYTSSNFEIADNLNKFFEPKFTWENVINMPVPAFRHNESISDVNISESVVLQKLQSLNFLNLWLRTAL